MELQETESLIDNNLVRMWNHFLIYYQIAYINL